MCESVGRAVHGLRRGIVGSLTARDRRDYGWPMSTKTAGRHDLLNDLFYPTLLFAALGGMTWAVRGSSGFGATKGCVFAGVMWGAAWWFIARDPSGAQSRRYTSAWIILALTFGIGISGSRGWGQWPNFFLGQLATNFESGNHEWVPVSRNYGFLWQLSREWLGRELAPVCWLGAPVPGFARGNGVSVSAAASVWPTSWARFCLTAIQSCFFLSIQRSNWSMGVSSRP